jgi:TldD protein
VTRARRLRPTPRPAWTTRISRTCWHRSHARVDFADLYFQYSRPSWSLEEGIVKSGRSPSTAASGSRAVRGKRAFAYSDDISLLALDEAATAARAIGRQGQSAHSDRPRRQFACALRPGRSSPFAVPVQDSKVALLERLEQMAKRTIRVSRR